MYLLRKIINQFPSRREKICGHRPHLWTASASDIVMVLKDTLAAGVKRCQHKHCLGNLSFTLSTQFNPLNSTTMDALKAQIASKRKALDNGESRPNKYMRRGDIERMKEEEERKAREEAVKKADEEAQKATLPQVRLANLPSQV
jgi:hypothetical protein